MPSDLTEVVLKTKLGSEYRFPDVSRAMLVNVLKAQCWHTAGTIILVNISGAVLTLPTRVAATLSYDGEVKWTGSPA